MIGLSLIITTFAKYIKKRTYPLASAISLVIFIFLVVPL